MNDLLQASTFFLIFAAMLVLYGAMLAHTGDKGLLPLNVVHSIRNEQDVRRVGRIVIIVGLFIAAAFSLLRVFVS